MSGIAGIFNLDGRPVDRELLRRMTDAAAERGLDDAGYWCDGQVGLGHRMFHTTPEALQEQQPLTDESGLLCLTFDGRVDNRYELKRALAAAGYRLRTDTDAEILLRAYECWGEQCARKVIGDFAFAIWDGRRQQLYCARDCLFTRPFCYYTNGHIFLFGSELHQLLESDDVPQQPNEGIIGEFLCGAIWNREETLWEGVQRLPSAHYLLVRADGVRKVKYWEIDPDYEIRYQREEEYVEHFLEVFGEAVRCRLRSFGPVGSHLSGGVDSSSVVCMVQELARRGTDITGFRTFSWIFPGQDCDESRYIRDVSERWGLDSHTWIPEITDVSFFADRAARYRDFPGYPNASMLNAYHVLAREQGYRVMLSGEGGDEWLRGGLDYFLEILLYSGPVAALCEAYKEGGGTGIGGLLGSVMKLYLKPLMPRRVLSTLRKHKPIEKVPRWIDRDFASRIHLQDRIRGDRDETPFTSTRVLDAGRASLYGMVNARWSPHSFEISDREDMRVGVEVRNPIMDRRIVELVFALPHAQRQRGKETKFILRQAMSGSLPESVRHRLDKADFMHFFADAFRLLGDEFCSTAAPVKLGWVKEAELRKIYRDFQACYVEGGSRKPIGGWGLWMTYAVGLWWERAVLRANPLAPSTINRKFELATSGT